MATALAPQLLAGDRVGDCGPPPPPPPPPLGESWRSCGVFRAGSEEETCNVQEGRRCVALAPWRRCEAVRHPQLALKGAGGVAAQALPPDACARATSAALAAGRRCEAVRHPQLALEGAGGVGAQALPPAAFTLPREEALRSRGTPAPTPGAGRGAARTTSFQQSLGPPSSVGTGEVAAAVGDATGSAGDGGMAVALVAASTARGAPSDASAADRSSGDATGSATAAIHGDVDASEATAWAGAAAAPCGGTDAAPTLVAGTSV
eukprot:TRINITY_DN3328_c1_g2_i1.p2 TRINITY_DN3328_c1_g2~~TRINITY_DN3328_c1_g2_i1.p2  ORF type:complete len:263 (+),score=53.75 TRINITY_DN3328_c1_g2_i1:326-1114(+)